MIQRMEVLLDLVQDSLEVAIMVVEEEEKLKTQIKSSLELS